MGEKNLKGELKKQNNLRSTLAMQIPLENHRENIMKYIVYRHTGMHVHITKSINLKAITKKWGGGFYSLEISLMSWSVSQIHKTKIKDKNAVRN